MKLGARFGFVGLSVLGLLMLGACGGKSTVREPTPLEEISNPALSPERLWSERAGSGTAGLVSGLRVKLAGNALYTADVNGRVFAYDPQSGDLIWKIDTKTRAISGPVVVDDKLLLGTRDAEVLALSKSDGGELWRQKMSSEVVGPPAGEGGIIVVRSVDGRVFGLTSGSGEPIWSFDRVVPNLVLRGSSAPLIQDGHAIIGMDNGRVASLRTSDGQPLWEQVIAVPSGRTELERLTDVDADLLRIDSCIVAVSFGGEIACLDEASGQANWRRSIKSYSGMAASDDKVFVTDESGKVWAIDQATGAAAWKQEALLYRRLSAPAYVDGFVVVGDLEGYLHWLSAESGSIVGRMKVGSDPIVLAPVVGDGKLFVINDQGRLAAIEMRPADEEVASN